MATACHKKTVLICMMVLGLGSLGLGQTAPSTSLLLETIKKNYSTKSPLKTKFTLTIFWKVREKTEKKQGSITCAPGERFNVAMGNEQFICNGDTYWNYNAKADQVVVKRLGDIDKSTLPSRLFSAFVAEGAFVEKERKNGIVLLVGENNATASTYTKITASVVAASGIIKKLSMIDKRGNEFTYIFSDTRFNEKFSKETFNFVASKKTRIVDMR